MDHNGSPAPGHAPKRRRFSLRNAFFRLRGRYYELRRNRMKAHYEKFRHRTVRSASVWYRLKVFAANGAHYVQATAASVFSFLSPVIFPVLGFCLIGVCIWFASFYQVGLSVRVGDQVLGYVRDSSDYLRISSAVEMRVKNESLAQTGSELYLVETFPSLHYEVFPRSQLTPEESLYEALYGMTSDYTRQSYGLFLDGELIATSKQRPVLESVLDTVLSYYTLGEDDHPEIMNQVEIVRGEYSSSYDLGYARILSRFYSGPNAVLYTAAAGDTLHSISDRFGIAEPVLRMMNRFSPDTELFEGQQLWIGEPYCQLTVKNTVTEIVTEQVPYEISYTYTDALFEGSRDVIQEGTNGLCKVVSHVVYLNGQPSAVTVVSRETVRESLPRTVLIGTKPISPSGHFIFPLKSYQYISSGFGWRWLRGSRNFHRGMDISARSGTPIYAADAGTVTFAGWDKYLGYYVQISHGNGISTVYGHCSSIAESIYEGKKVYQGELIAYVGRTGNTTGNHLHFAIYNERTKEYLDPADYL